MVPGPSIEILTVDTRLFHQIELARPGYYGRVRRYLDNGHIGFAISDSMGVRALAWAIHNSSATIQRVEYFPLEPNNVWLHAAWTHEMYRGRGYHTALIIHRAQIACTLWPDSLLVANISTTNARSLSNYEKLGFEVAGALWTARWLNRQYGRHVK